MGALLINKCNVSVVALGKSQNEKNIVIKWLCRNCMFLRTQHEWSREVKSKNGWINTAWTESNILQNDKCKPGNYHM